MLKWKFRLASVLLFTSIAVPTIAHQVTVSTEVELSSESSDLSELKVDLHQDTLEEENGLISFLKEIFSSAMSF